MAWWRSVQRDDIFAPSVLQLTSPATTITFKGYGGIYEVAYDWELVS
ncbi:MAG: hypothetical protein OHK0015_36630 [Chloroflexi bacterium OHK40]